MTNDSSTKECPFCSPQVDGVVFAESARFRAIYNIAPILPGHSLIVPKAHKRGVLDLDDAEACEMSVFAKKVTGFLQAAFKSDGINWTIQDGASAGQSVSHLHLHLIPRSEGDLPHPGEWYPLLKQSTGRFIDDATRTKLSPDQLRAIVEHLRNSWNEFSAS